MAAKAKHMIIIAQFDVTELQRRQIAARLGRPGLADRETVRDYLQQHGVEALTRLGHPLINHEAH